MKNSKKPRQQVSLGASSLRPFPLDLTWHDVETLLRRDTDCRLYLDEDRYRVGLPPPLKLYAGVSDATWNGWPTLAGPYVCISPIYGRREKRTSSIALNPSAHILLDSGAFSDAFLFEPHVSFDDRRITHFEHTRLTPGEALERQYQHMERYKYRGQVEAISSYDVLIDECWLPGAMGKWSRTKRRWTEQEADWAVEETIKAAAYLDAHRDAKIKCVINIQGVTPTQYLSCAQHLLRYIRPGDWVGLGGWCATGRFPAQILPVFRATMKLLIPFLAQVGLKRLHLWGVCYAPALGELLYLTDQFGMELSTDSAMPAVRPTRGNWGYADWSDVEYKKRRPPLHLPAARYLNEEMQDADFPDDLLWMHYLLTHDEEFASDHLQDEHKQWMLDEELMDWHWSDVLAAFRKMNPAGYSQVRTYRGSWVDVIDDQGAHRVEHVHQVRDWLAGLHQTRWYRAIQEN